MKKFLGICIGISVVLLSAALCFFAFGKAFAAPTFYNSSSNQLITAVTAKILWVNIDSIDVNYKGYAALSKTAGDEYNAQMAVYQSKAVDLQKRYEALQTKSQQETISAEDAAKEEAAINLGMDDLKILENQLNLKQAEAMEKNNEITKEVTSFLERYAINHQANYIFGCGGGYNLLYGDKKLDATNEVIGYLNAQYDQLHPH